MQLNSTHISTNSFIHNEIKNSKLFFTIPEFNLVYDSNQVNSLRRVSGYNLTDDFNNSEMLNFVFNKIAIYKLDYFKYHQKIKNFRSSINRQKKVNFMALKNISLLDYFYMYRIKTDYKDVSFLNSTNNYLLYDFYYTHSFNFSENIYLALKDLIDDLSLKRLNVRLF